MSRTDDLMAAMQGHFRDTAFMFTRTAKGFDIALDLGNPRWWVILEETRLADTSDYSIVIDEIDSKFTIVETPRRIEWDAEGAPRFAASSAGTSPRRLNEQVDLRVSVEPVRRLVRKEAESLGFNESFDRTKLFVMLGVAAGCLVAVGIVFAVLINTMQGGA